jgi:L-threonylcarbamoyladenylate synthase
MRTAHLRVDPVAPDPHLVAEAAAVLRSGGLVAFPTETVYGLGANALDAAAVARIFQAKERPANNPMIVHAGDSTVAQTLAATWPAAATRLSERFWPGPLTLVLPKRPEVPGIVTAGAATVAVRVPAHPVALALLGAAAIPIAAPSANRSSRLSPTTAKHVLGDLNGRIEMVLDAGPCAVGVESTVLDLTTDPPRLLRPGHITPAAIADVIGPISMSTLVGPDTSDALPAPGMLARHYAPRAPLECFEGDAAERAQQLCRAGERVGWLRLSRGQSPTVPGLTLVDMPSDPVDYAARLYAELHALDAAGRTRIIVEMPPDEEAWLAVRDRLRRAAS